MYDTEELIYLTLAELADKGDLSWIALTRFLREQGFDDLDGDGVIIAHPQLMNMVLWARVSPVFVEFVNKLRQTGKIVISPCPFMRYALEGQGIDGAPMLDMSDPMTLIVNPSEPSWVPTTMWHKAAFDRTNATRMVEDAVIFLFGGAE